MIFCPTCAVVHGRPNWATLTGDQWENATTSVFDGRDDFVSARERRVVIIFRAQCKGCGSFVVTEQSAIQNPDGSWHIDRLAQ